MRKLFYTIRIQVFLIVLAMGGILIAGHFTVLQPLLNEILFEQELKQVRTAANTTAQAVDQEMILAVKSLESLAARDEFSSMDQVQIAKTLEVFDSINQYFIYTWALDSSGKIIAAPSRPDRRGEDRSYRDYYISPTPENRTHFQKVQVSTRGNFSLVIGTVILNEKNEKIGVVAGSLGLMDRNPQVYEAVLNAPFPEEFKVFLVTDKNILLAHSDKVLPHPSQENLKLLINQTLKDYWKEGKQEAEFIIQTGQKYILGLASVPMTDWRVIIQVPDVFVTEKIRLITQKLTFLLGILLFIMLIIGSFFVERIARSLSRLTLALKSFGDKGEAEPVLCEGGGEIKDAIEAFNKMVIDRNMGESALKESEERFRTIFENSSDGILIADFESKRFVASNSRICDMLGYDCEEILNLGVTDIHPQKELPGVLDKFAKQARGEILLAENLPVLRKDGSFFYADISSAPFFLFGNHCIIGIFRDITKRRNAEIALKKTEARQALILRSLPMAFYIAQPFGDFGGIWVSEQIDEITGFASEQFAENIHLWSERLHPDDRSMALSAFESIIAKETITVEYRWQHKDGLYRWFQDNAALVRDEDGNPAEIIGTWLDISANKKVEKDLRHVQKMESIGNLAGGIAHDFNNILMAIFGNIGLAKMKVDNPDQLLDHLERINQAAIRAKELVEQILTFSRRAELDIHPVRVDVVIKEALKLLRASIPVTIEIREEIGSQLPVLADQTQLHQVIMNLCTNAYHAMRETGGILKVALREINVTLDDSAMGLEVSPGRYVQLEVSDSGCGIMKEDIDRIFEPYFTTKEYGDGIGLGLAVVHGIIKDHHGYIKVYSEPGKGATFHIYLPVSETDAEMGDTPPEVEPVKGGNEHLMLVDDEDENITLIKEILTKYGYTVDVFTNGVQAWQEFQKQPDKYDLIITDMTMPFMTGAELAQKIIGVRPKVPVILFTGYSEMINRGKSMAIGIKEFIQKPMVMNQLLKSVRQVLDKKEGAVS